MFLQPRKILTIGMLVWVSAAASQAEAQVASFRTQAGEEFQYDTDASVRVLNCYARNDVDYCLVNWGIVSQGFWSIPVEVWRIDLDKLSRDFGASAPTIDPVVVPDEDLRVLPDDNEGFSSDDDRPVEEDRFKPNQQIAGPVGIPGCDPSVYTGFVPDSVPPSEELFRAKITDQFTMRAYDNWYYGVEFSSFDVGVPFNNDITIDPAQGALLASFGAPPNVTLYPVTTTFRVCEKESASTYTERFHDSTYFCFPKDGEWTCGVSESR